MFGYNSLNKSHFRLRMISSAVIRICAFALVAAAMVSAAPVAGSQSVVKADTRTGRLVRRVEVHPSMRAASQWTKSKVRPEIRKVIEEKARKHDVDPNLIESVIQVESNYDALAVSPKGALGLMQLIPATASRFGVRNAFDAEENVEGGVKYLKHLQTLYSGDNRLALAAYNAGEGAVARYGGVPPYSETQNYVVEVARRYDIARKQNPSQAVEIRAPRIEQFTDADGRIHIELR